MRKYAEVDLISRQIITTRSERKIDLTELLQTVVENLMWVASRAAVAFCAPSP